MSDTILLWEKIGELERRIAAMQRPEPPEGLGWIPHFLNWLLANAAALGVLVGTVAGVLLIVLILRFLGSGGGRIKEGKLSLAGNTLTVEAAAQQLDERLTDVQNAVVRATAERRLEDRRIRGQVAAVLGKLLDSMPGSGAAMTEARVMVGSILAPAGDGDPGTGDKGAPGAAGSFSDAWAEVAKGPPLNILWLSDAGEKIAFERDVLLQMGHDVQVFATVAAATSALRGRNDWDVVLSDSMVENSDVAVPQFFRALQGGIKTAGHLAEGRVLKIGPDLRFAIFTLPRTRHVAQGFLDRLCSDENRPHCLVATDFAYLQDRLNWVQEDKATRA